MIKDAKTSRAFELLENEDLESLNNDVIILSSRHSKAMEEQRQGVIASDDFQIKVNQIHLDVLNLLEQIGKKPADMEHVEAPLSTETKKSVSISKTKSVSTPVASADKIPPPNNTKRNALIGGLALLMAIAGIAFFLMNKKETKKIDANRVKQEQEKTANEANAKKDNEAFIKQRAQQRQDSIKRAKEIVLGNTFEGGVIFYIDETKAHGLIAATSDVTIDGKAPLIEWYNGMTPKRAGAINSGIYGGKENTEKLIAKFGEGISPAILAKNYEPSQGKNDWYLPSKKELDLLWDFYNKDRSCFKIGSSKKLD